MFAHRLLISLCGEDQDPEMTAVFALSNRGARGYWQGAKEQLTGSAALSLGWYQQ